MSSSTSEDLEKWRRRLARRHHLAGWCGLFVFVSLGLFLEALHGFKAGYYLDAPHKLRRELWTLAHAHGTLLSLIQVGFAAGLPHLGRWTVGRLRLASFFFLDALALVPLGFFLGGLDPTDADPGLGVWLVPPGAVLLLVAVGLTAWGAVTALPAGDDSTSS